MPLCTKTTKTDEPHAVERAKTRYGIVLTLEVEQAILKQARTQPIKRVFRASVQRYLCTIRYAKKTMRIVTNDKIDRIITFLPRKVKYRETENHI